MFQCQSPTRFLLILHVLKNKKKHTSIKNIEKHVFYAVLKNIKNVFNIYAQDHSRSFEMTVSSRACVSHSIETIHVSLTVSDILNIR